VGLEALRKTYHGSRAVDDVSLDIAAGSFVSLLGPSGSGKTTTLNLIAGFVTPDSGRVLFDGQLVSTTPPHKRDIGMVFQSYALFPHLSVFDNVAYPLRMRTRLRGRELQTRVAEALELVQLLGKERRFPRQLSGGQQQRVAMARALVSRPRLLLMDEPLGALDKALRENLQVEIKEIHRKLGSTFIYVTHDQNEALTMSDMLVVMRDGRIAQTGEPRQVYDFPNSSFVASFLGDANLLPAVLLKSSGDLQDLGIADGVTVSVRTKKDNSFLPGGKVMLLIRPEDLRVHAAVSSSDDTDTLPATLTDIRFFGNFCKLTVRIGGAVIGGSDLKCFAHPSATAGLQAGRQVRLSWDRSRARILPAAG
jgi:putative spermidine/putrescine transport system ATP-binding protein